MEDGESNQQKWRIESTKRINSIILLVLGKA